MSLRQYYKCVKCGKDTGYHVKSKFAMKNAKPEKEWEIPDTVEKLEKKEGNILEIIRKPDYQDGLIQKYHFKTLKDTEEIWYYQKETGNFVDMGEPLIKEKVELHFKGEPGIDRTVNEVLGSIQRRTYVNRNDFNPKIEWLACKNCMINVRTGETKEFDPRFMNTTSIPVVHNPEAKCPSIMKFLKEIVSAEDAEIILDFMAYCLWREYKFNNWILLNGAGQNGKTTLLNLIARFLGIHNVSAESLKRLLEGRFTVAQLYQKLVNIDADLSGDIFLRNTGEIKKLTGNDEIAGEKKHKDPFKFRNYAKLIFSCNKIPETGDDTDAWFRRLIIINFERQFLGDNEDRNLIEKLTNEEELSGLLNELLARLPKVLQNGIRPTTNKILAETYDKYVMSSNPVRYFLDNAVAISSKNEDHVPKDKMYDSYFWFCKEKKLATESEQSFSRKMTDAGYKNKQFRFKDGTKPYCWINVKLVDWNKPVDEDQTTLESIPLTEKEKEKEELK
jgi:putative DNA primase/helicase